MGGCSQSHRMDPAVRRSRRLDAEASILPIHSHVSSICLAYRFYSEVCEIRLEFFVRQHSCKHERLMPFHQQYFPAILLIGPWSGVSCLFAIEVCVTDPAMHVVIHVQTQRQLLRGVICMIEKEIEIGNTLEPDSSQTPGSLGLESRDPEQLQVVDSDSRPWHVPCILQILILINKDDCNHASFAREEENFPHELEEKSIGSIISDSDHLFSRY